MLQTNEAVELLLNPKSVVFIGASSSEEKSSGLGIRNLLHSDYAGEIYAVNPKGIQIEDKVAYTSIEELPDGIDVAFVTVKAKLTPQTVRSLGAKGIKVAIVAVGGFAELGSDSSKDLQQELTDAAKEAGVRIVGPVCNGIYNTSNYLALGYNTVHSKKLRQGSIGLVSHSGALLGPLVDAIEECGVGLSKFFSCGSEIDMCMADYMEWLVDDPLTKVIALVVDRVGDGKRFRRVLKKAKAAGKPVVALKLGDSAVGRKATMAHSSHLAGAKEAYEAVLSVEGVKRVFTLESLATTCTILATGRKAKSNHVTACSTSGGGAIMLADRMAERNIPMTTLDESTVAAIKESLRFGSQSILNPFDLGLGGRDFYHINVENLGRDKDTGALICYGTPMQTAAKRIQMAQAFTDVAKTFPELPVIVLFPNTMEPEEQEIYDASQVPVVSSVYEAIYVANAIITPSVDYPEEANDVEYCPETKKLFAQAGDVSFSEYESKQFLAAGGVKMPKERFVTDPAAAAAAAAEIGYPVVLKACGRTISHKSDYRLLEVGIRDETALKAAYAALEERLAAHPELSAEGFLVCEMVKSGVEVIFGVTRDDEFGQIAILGPGGVLAELMGSDAMARAPLPLDRRMIEEMIDKTILSKLLAGYRGGAKCDRSALVEQIFHAAKAVEELGDDVAALDVNPIVVLPEGEGAWALDALLIKKQ